MAETSATPLSDQAYRERAEALLAQIEATADRWLQDDVADVDTHRTGGLLQLSFPNGSQLVINTQPPLQEVWLAARSGGYHFRFQGERWVDTKSGREFFEAVSTEATAQAGVALSVAG